MKLNRGNLFKFTLSASFANFTPQDDKIVVAPHGLPGALTGKKEQKNDKINRSVYYGIVERR